MNKFIESIISKDFITAEKEFNRDINEKVTASIENIKQQISESLLESTDSKQNFKVFYQDPDTKKEFTTVLKANSHSHAKRLVRKFAGDHVNINDSKQLNEAEALEESKKAPMEEAMDPKEVSKRKFDKQKFTNDVQRVMDLQKQQDDRVANHVKNGSKKLDEMDANNNGEDDDKEDLNEISKKTLGSYVKGATQDYARHAMKVNQSRTNRSKIAHLTNTNDYSNDEMKALKNAQSDMYDANSKDEAQHMKNARKREKGISKAVDKLAKD